MKRNDTVQLFLVVSSLYRVRGRNDEEERYEPRKDKDEEDRREEREKAEREKREHAKWQRAASLSQALSLKSFLRNSLDQFSFQLIWESFLSKVPDTDHRHQALTILRGAVQDANPPLNYRGLIRRLVRDFYAPGMPGHGEAGQTAVRNNQQHHNRAELSVAPPQGWNCWGNPRGRSELSHCILNRLAWLKDNGYSWLEQDAFDEEGGGLAVRRPKTGPRPVQCLMTATGT